MSLLLPAQIGSPGIETRNGNDPYKEKREELAKSLDYAALVNKQEVLQAFQEVPRDLFVPDYLKSMAYNNDYLPLGNGGTLIEPSLLLRIISHLNINAQDNILLLGSNTGYSAAILSRFCKTVYVIEEDQVTEQYRRIYATLGYTNIILSNTPNPTVFINQAPFDGIIIHGSVTRVPADLFSQLAGQGRIIFPLSDGSGFQILTLLQNNEKGVSLTSLGTSFMQRLNSFKF